MKLKIITFTGLAVIMMAITAVSGFNLKSGADSVNESNEKIRIAACPSCYKVAGRLDTARYKIIPTQSTSQSIALLQAGQADMILAGRTLKPGEPLLDSVALGEGYSFLGSEEISIRSSQLDDYTFFTDLDAEKISTLFGITNVTHTDDVYEYLEKGIVLTTWENTDYGKARVVHVIENDGQRFALSRRPTLYCPKTCDDETASQFILAVKDIQS